MGCHGVSQVRSTATPSACKHTSGVKMGISGNNLSIVAVSHATSLLRHAPMRHSPDFAAERWQCGTTVRTSTTN